MNKVLLMGRLTKDPDTRYTNGNNTAAATFTLAVNRRTSKEGQPQADFINIVAWRNTAEFCGKYFTKGMQVAELDVCKKEPAMTTKAGDIMLQK